MTKLNHYIRAELQAAVDGLAEMFWRANPCTVDPVAVLDMVLLQEDRRTLERAAEIVGHPPANSVWVKIHAGDLLPSQVTGDAWKTMSMNMLLTFPKPMPMLLPTMLTPKAGVDLREIPGLTEWLRWRIKAGVVLGALKAVIERAYVSETTLEQLRYSIPGILMLCKRREFLNKYVDRLQQFKVPSSLPRVNPEMRAFYAEVNELLGVAALLEAAIPTTSLVQVNPDSSMKVQYPGVGGTVAVI